MHLQMCTKICFTSGRILYKFEKENLNLLNFILIDKILLNILIKYKKILFYLPHSF